MTSKGDIYPAFTISTSGAVTGSADVYLIDATAGAVAITLPSAASLLLARRIFFRRIDTVSANSVTLTCAGSDTIGTVSSLLLDIKSKVELEVISSSKWQVVTERDNYIPYLDLGSTTPLTIDCSYVAYTGHAPGAPSQAVSLPSIASIGIGRELIIRNDIASVGSVDITPNGTDTIDGIAGTISITNGSSTIYVATAGNWRTVMNGN